MARKTVSPKHDLLSRRHYLLDLSMVPVLVGVRRNLPRGSLLVPTTLDGLLRAEPSDELAQLLTTAAMPPDPTGIEIEAHTITQAQLQAIRDAYRALAERGVITIIDDEEVSNPAFRKLLDLLSRDIADGPTVQPPNGTAVTPRGLVRTHLATVLNYSSRKGTAILSQGRSLVGRLRGWIPIFELPDKLDQVVAKKQAFQNRIFRTPRRRTGKYVFYIALAITGVALPDVASIDVAGIVLAVVEP